MSFLVIVAADGLSAEETRRVKDVGPEHITPGDGYGGLLEDAGFMDLDIVDVTEDYLAAQAAWIGEWKAERSDFEQLLGVKEYAERHARDQGALAAGRAGLMRRYLISVV